MRELKHALSRLAECLESTETTVLSCSRIFPIGLVNILSAIVMYTTFSIVSIAAAFVSYIYRCVIGFSFAQLLGQVLQMTM